MFCVPLFSRKWKFPKVAIGLLALEFAATVAVLTMFGIAAPNLYRTKLWQVGADNGFNSSPTQILYAYANHRPIPKTPFIWSQTLTDFNIAISVLSMFIMLVKFVLFSLHIWFPFVSNVINVILTALYCVSIYGQAGPDKSDPKRPSSSAWYLSKSCSYAKPSGNEHYCIMAKGTFAATVIMTFVFILHLILGIYSMIPTAAQRAADKIEIDDMQGDATSEHHHVEMKNVHKATATPYTPRTLAFNTLDRQLPLRAQDSKTRYA
ncbi:Uncharacterized protein BP5553_08573 [Venustampulla echinocandica]|uniref:MARVEL domain-containing protein n=1 Tax=Venustampulla echinocandica TaxID=2656787 RepID=A0A370TEL4_9HELO|nr:Uncharacterized protein BP5553_08573 [Venustampulla echinocandica]RDL33134.1 Uncharacterized protein BP5553_08573 [Venustampulla echinocandica]